MSHAGASPHWERMWKGGLPKGAAFDCGEASPSLVSELGSVPAPKPGARALVPGCGRAYDALALARHGFDAVVAVDLSPSAVAAAKAELASTGDAAASKVELVCADFFALDEKTPYDLVWDATFLCALAPSVREKWAAKHRALLAPGGSLITCVFPICDKAGGPPYAMSKPLVAGLLEPAGFAKVRERDCGPGDKHTAGGASLGGPGTAVVAWTKEPLTR